MDYNQPWDTDRYETGSTTPPKNNGGSIAVILAVALFAICLSGILKHTGITAENTLPSQPTADIGSNSTPTPTELQSYPDETRSAAPTEGALFIGISPSELSVPNIPQEGGLSLQEIYKKAIPSAVSISTSRGSGSGVVISEDGYVVTNCHVVENGTDITVLLYDESSFPARIVGMDDVTDLAVLKIEADNLVPAEFGDSEVLQVGDLVVAIGDPLGISLRGTMTDGIVSAINRNITISNRNMTLIQTNAALNSGNSGGPLLNCYGQVIGINTAKMSQSLSSSSVEGLGFAIPSTTVRDIVNQLMTQGYVSGRPTLDFEGESVTLFYQRYYRLPAGVYVTSLKEGSPLAQAGLVEGDVILSFEDTSVTDVDTLYNLILNKEVGDTASLTFYHRGTCYSTEVTLVEARG